MPSQPKPNPHALIVQRWRKLTEAEGAGPFGLFFLIALLLVLVAGRLLRAGLVWGPVAGAFSLAGLVVAFTLWWWRRRRLANDPRGMIDTLGAHLGLPQREAIYRAYNLWKEPKDEGPVARELSELHLRRKLIPLSQRKAIEQGQARAKLWKRAALGGVAALCLGILLGPMAAVEGIDLLAAKDGVAPVSLPYVQAIEVRVTPPAYLHKKPWKALGTDPIQVPRGSRLRIRIVPLVKGRNFVLRAGSSRLPLVSDGKGTLQTEVTVAKSQTLQVAASFHGKLVLGSGSLKVTAIADLAPVVKLEGAPGKRPLAEGDTVPLKYSVRDDHGIEQVVLVVKVGRREERTVLENHHGQKKNVAGGYTLTGKHRLLKGAFLPVVVRIEARDNDVVGKNKWGRSEALVLEPPVVGSKAAEGYAGITKVLKGALKVLAQSLGTPWPAKSPAQKSHSKAFVAGIEGVRDAMLKQVAELRKKPAAGKRRLRAAPVHFDDLEKALAKLSKRPSKKGYEGAREAYEDVVLGWSHFRNRYGAAQTVFASRVVAQVAETLAQECALLERRPANTPPAEINAAKRSIKASGRAVAKLGGLGRDLGGIMLNGERRIGSLTESSKWLDARRASQDLAGRLARPEPSFMGGSGKGGSTESGSSPGGGGGSSDGQPQDSQGEEAAKKSALKDLQELSIKHGSESRNVEEALEKAERSALAKELLEEARKHADKIRKAAELLPRESRRRGRAVGRAARGRDAALQMADSLESLDLEEAQSASETAERLLKSAERDADLVGGGRRFSRRLAESQRRLKPEREWLKKLLERAAKIRSAKRPLKGHARNQKRIRQGVERLSNKTKGQKGSKGFRKALKEAQKAMKRAEKALRDGKGQAAKKAQGEAARKLEVARSLYREQTTEPEKEADKPPAAGGKEGESADGDPRGGKTKIPGAEGHRGPEAFRKRVLKGLSQGSGGKLRGALRRYTEGLLK